MTKANTWVKDTCDAANAKWLYPLTDQMDTYVIQNKYVNFTSTFYNLYQSLYRVKNVCNVTISENGNERNYEKFLTFEWFVINCCCFWEKQV